MKKLFGTVKRLVVYFLGMPIRKHRYNKVKQNRIIVQESMLQLNSLTVTIHGRLMLTKVIHDPDNGLPDEIRRMYMVLLQTAPIQQWAARN